MVDQAIRRPAGHVVIIVLRARRKPLQRPFDGARISGSRATGLRDRAPAAAAEVDPESLEYAGRPEVGGDDLTDRGSLE